MYKPNRQDLARSYANRPMRRLVQIDVDPQHVADDEALRNMEAPLLQGSADYALQHFAGIRLSFPAGTNQEAVQRALWLMLTWVEQGDLWEPMPCEMTGLERPSLAGESEPAIWPDDDEYNDSTELDTDEVQPRFRVQYEQLQEENQLLRAELIAYQRTHRN